MRTLKGLFDLSGKIAVVTGAAGKLGKVWVDALLKAGASVFAIDKRPMFIDKSARPFIADITSREDVLNALDACIEIFGAPEILINNAGIDVPPESTDGLKLGLFEKDEIIFNINAYGTLVVTRLFGGEMAIQKRGSIINIGSLYASVSPDQRIYDHMRFIKPAAYGASKAAVVNITKYFATLWAKQGVRVNCLSPGGVIGDQDEEFIKKYCDRVPMGRMATDNDLVGPMLFLASAASSYVTGTEIIVDGGYTAW